jgi:cytochrome c-type biogenesis protein CcmH
MTVLLWSLAIALSTVAGSAQQPSDEAALDARLQAFARQVRCLVCQNETLAESQADLAADLRREIREQMKAGKTDDEIRTYLVERYGEFVLYRPPLRPSTYVLWFGPFLLLGAGALTLRRSLARWSRAEPAAVAAAQLRKRARRLLEAASRKEAV